MHKPDPLEVETIKLGAQGRHHAGDGVGGYCLGADDGGRLALVERAAKAACYQFIRDA
jgi:hypothetical protein